MSHDRLAERMANIGWGIALILVLCFWVVVVFVAAHFVAKYW